MKKILFVAALVITTTLGYSATPRYTVQELGNIVLLNIIDRGVNDIILADFNNFVVQEIQKEQQKDSKYDATKNLKKEYAKGLKHVYESLGYEAIVDIKETKDEIEYAVNLDKPISAVDEPFIVNIVNEINLKINADKKKATLNYYSDSKLTKKVSDEKKDAAK